MSSAVRDSRTREELLFITLKFLKGFGVFDEAIKLIEDTIYKSSSRLLPASLEWPIDDLSHAKPVASSVCVALYPSPLKLN